METKKRACVYTRVSTSEQANEGYSIDEQERMCRAAIESKDWECVGVYSDPGISGRSLNRPGLKEMLAAIVSGQVDAVVVYKLDRLSRKQKDTMMLIEDVFLKKSIDLVSLNETLDTSTPWGRAMIGILSSFNQMESETIQGRTAMGRKAKAKEGGYAGGRPPIGYDVVNGELVVNKKEAEMVRLVFELRRSGLSLHKITDEINKRGYRNSKGTEFKHSTIQVILGNEGMYRGEYKYGCLEAPQGKQEAILK